MNNVGDAISNVDGRVTNNTTAITNLGDQLNAGTIGLVQQDATTRDITVAKATDGTRVNFTGTAGDRLLSGVAKGMADNDGVNVSQLKGAVSGFGGDATVNPDGTVTGPTYNVGGTTTNNVGDALNAVDGRVTNLGDQINNGTVGLVQQDATSRNITVAKDTDGTQVSFAGTAGDRVLTGVAKGAVNATSTEAVNGSQLYGTNKSVADALGGGSQVNPDGTITGPTYTVDNKPVTNVGDAISNIDGRVTNLGDTVNNINNGGGIKYFRANSTAADAVASGTDSVAIGPQASASAASAVALGNGSVADRANTVSVGSASLQRQVANVAAGTANTDAVNVSQLKGAVDGLGGGAKVNPDGTVTGPTYVINGKPVTNVGDAITNLGDTINNGEIGLVQQDATSKNITVAKAKDGKQVDFTGTEGARVLTGVAKGAVNATSTEGVNGSQLYGTNKSVADALGGGSQVNPDGTITGPTYTVDNKPVTNVGDALTNIDGRVTNNSTAITRLGDQINNGGLGLVRQDTASRDITVAAATDGTRVNFTGTAGDRVLAGVAKGMADNDGVNVSQLKGAVDGLGGGAKVNPDGTVTGPTYVINGKPVTNVGDAITNLGDTINNGEIGLVQQDATSKNITVAKAKDGKQVDFTGTEGARVLTGVAKGAVNATSTEGVNGSQLYGTNKSVADALGGGSQVNPDGTINGPTYSVGGTTVNNVGDAISNVDGRVTNNSTAITNLGDQINNGTVGLVQQDASTRDITVAKAADGTRVNFTGTAGDRVLAGVAKGAVNATSAEGINGAQLYGTNKSVADALGGGAQVNPDGTINGPTYSVGGTTVTNVGDALRNVDGRVTNNSTAITNLGDQINNGTVGLVQQDSASRDINVARSTDGTRINFAGTAGDRSLSGVAMGRADNDGVNVAQLKGAVDGLGGGAKVNPDGTVTGPSYTVNGKTINNVGDALTEVDGRVTQVDRRVTNLGDQINGGGGIKYFRANSSLGDATASGLNSVAIGPLALASAANAVALGNGAVADRANTVSVGSASAQRQLVNLARGSADTDAVNVSQLKGAVNAFGGGSKVNPDGTVTGPTYVVNGKTVTNVGDAITNLEQKIGNTTTGLVQQDATTREITVAKGNDGSKVNFTGSQGERTLTGVAKGAVNQASNEAVNGAQLYGSNKAIADALGGGSQVNPDGTVTGPTYVVNGAPVTNVGDALTNIDGRVSTNSAAIQNLVNGGGVKYLSVKSSAAAASATGAEAVAVGPQSSAAGAAGVAVGSGAKAEADNSVALGAGSIASKANSVSVGSAGKERSITNVAAGTDDTDAVNVSQLKQSQEGTARYDSQGGGQGADYTSLSLGGPGGRTTTTVRNVRAGVAGTDAVNVDQLQAGMGPTLSKARTYTDSRIQQVQQDAWTARREARGGTAAAMAMAGMPQAYLPGKSMLAAAASTFQGESALAIGLSGVTDNGRYVYKAQTSANTRGDFGFTVGAGIQW